MDGESQIDEHVEIKWVIPLTKQVKVLGFRRQVHKEWITTTTWKLTDKRRNLKKLSNTYSERLEKQYTTSNKELSF